MLGLSSCASISLSPPTATASGETAQAAYAAQTMAFCYRDADGFALTVEQPLSIPLSPMEAIYAQRETSLETARTAALGLTPLLPADLAVEVEVRGGVATVDIQNSFLFRTAQAERQAVACIVQTLCERGDVSSVQLTQANGETVLPHGTDISQLLSMSPSGIAGGNEDGQLLYFISPDSGFLIPYRVQVADVAQAVQAMLAPDTLASVWAAEQATPAGLLPTGTQLLSSQQYGDTLQLSFSREIQGLEEYPELEARALAAIAQVCREISGCEQVEIYAEGVRMDAAYSDAINVWSQAYAAW